MQNINTDIAKAFAAGKSKKIKNTWTDGKTVCLHGNPIAIRAHPRIVKISMGGYRSRTSFDRLKAIVSEFGRSLEGGPYSPELVSPGQANNTIIKNSQAWYVIAIPEATTT